MVGSNTPISVNDPTHIASTGKSFTSAVWGVLVSQGKARWEDTVQSILSKAGVAVEGLQQTYAGATVREILANRAG